MSPVVRLAAVFVIVIVVVALFAAAEGPVPGPDRGPYPIPRTEGAIVVDGVLDEAAWEGAWSMELGFEVSPGENIPPPVRTVVLVTHDESAVYFAFRAFDPDPGEIRAHLSDRDNIGADDWVAVVLDTFNDQRRSFDFMVNPLGVQSDFVETTADNGGGAWDTIWDSAGLIHDWGYAVEMRIPFSSLRFQRTDGPQVWGFDAVRVYPRSDRHQMGLFARDRGNLCYLCQAILIEGFEGVSPGRNIELVPTVTGLRSDQRATLPDGELVAGDVDVEAGITARWGFSPNLTLSATLNPDFSQVEADARQLDVNERFALFYPDKRPFFMEGADFFSGRFNLLHTRTMHDPDWGLKITGKEGAHTVGAYLVEDAVTNLLLPGVEGSRSASLDGPSRAAVLRYKYDIGSHLTLGTMLTHRSGDGGYRNTVLEVDGSWQFTDSDRVQLELFATTTRYPDELAVEHGQPMGDFEDWAIDLLWVHHTRRVDAWALIQRVGDGVRTDLGFNPQVGTEAAVLGSEYKWIPDEDSWFSHLEVGLEHIEILDGEASRLLSRESLTYLIYQGPLQTHSTFHLYRREEGVGDHRFAGWDTKLHHCMKPTGNAHLYVNAAYGDRVDYAAPQLGRRLHLNPGVVLNLGRHLLIDASHLYERMTVDAGELYTANITQGTLTYQFSTRTFVRALLQYVANDFTAPDKGPKKRLRFGQLLFSYKLNPQTVFFLGYTENQLGTGDFPLTTTGRTLFAKIGYAWRL